MSLPRWLVGIFAALGAIFVIALLAALLFGGRGWLGGGRVAVLPVHGVIDGDDEFREELRRFRDDPTVKAVVIDIDSPGGAVAPSQSMYQELRKLRDEGMPIVASIGSVGASGGYYVALAADTILALPGSITGSIGVIMEFPNAGELLDRVGLEMQTVKSSAHKDIGSPFRDLDPAERELLQAMVSDVYEQFVGTVEAERKLPATRVRELADGRLLSGRQAVAARLIDRTGNLPDAVALAGRMAGLGDDPEVLRPPEKGSSLLDLVFGTAAEAVSRRIDARVADLRAPRVLFQLY